MAEQHHVLLQFQVLHTGQRFRFRRLPFFVSLGFVGEAGEFDLVVFDRNALAFFVVQPHVFSKLVPVLDVDLLHGGVVFRTRQVVGILQSLTSGGSREKRREEKRERREREEKRERIKGKRS